MSSFLGRAAQFYATTVPALLTDLLEPTGWDWRNSTNRRDLDMNPPSALELALRTAVNNWVAPLYDHQGFKHWTLATRCRDAYCPECFQEDLQTGRTPYFRMDWIPVLVTSCWKHCTPLFKWEDTTTGGIRRLPKQWLYGPCKFPVSIPAFMTRHLALLEKIRRNDIAPEIKSALDCLRAFQECAEKQSTTPVFRDTDERSLRSATQHLVLLGARHLRRHKEPPLASLVKLPRCEDLFEASPRYMQRRIWEQTEEGVRQTSRLGWRRTYLLFAAKTLQRSVAFGHLFPGPRGAHRTWKAWWRADVHPYLGDEGKMDLDWSKQRFMPSLSRPPGIR